MRIRIGNRWIEPTPEAPILVCLTPLEAQSIKASEPDAHWVARFAPTDPRSRSDQLAWLGYIPK